jgi:BASS family bile acid:Na+ symporter
MDIDAIRINFNPEQLGLLNACLAFIMFGVALDLRLEKFAEIFRKPGILLAGMFSQLILLPLFSLGLILLLQPPSSLATGMLLVAVCPGGNVSNYATHLSGSNTALSVTMTTLSTLLAALSTPFFFEWLLPLLPEGGTGRRVSVDAMAMVLAIVELILLPLIAGSIFRQVAPGLAQRLLLPVQRLSMVIFISFVLVAVYGNLQNIVRYLHLIFFLVFAHNSLSLALGYFWARAVRCEVNDARAIAIETGIQNSGLALLLTFNFFGGSGGMALIAAWWGIWHLVSAFALAMYWRRSSQSRSGA